MTILDLHKLAWIQPISQIAKEYGISPKDFKIICLENKIPIPKPGYWSKVKFGKAVKRIDLPIEIDSSKEIDLGVYLKVQSDKTLKSQIIKPKQWHPLVVKTRKELKISESYRDSVFRMEWNKQKDILPIHTDKKLQERALRFMNIFIANMEDRGMQIKFDYGRCHIELYEQTIEINLRQKYHRTRTIDESGWSNQEFIKSKKLEFLTGYNERKSWIDSDKMKIEERIPQILDYIEKELTYWRDFRKKQSQLNRIEELELQKQKEIESLQKLEEEKTKQLFLDVDNWQRAKFLRKFIEAKKKNEISKGAFNKESQKWLEWATHKANELDPLI